jgi:capsular polysaccharide biosynthesis protein
MNKILQYFSSLMQGFLLIVVVVVVVLVGGAVVTLVWMGAVVFVAMFL